MNHVKFRDTTLYYIPCLLYEFYKGFIVNFISTPVISAFTSAAALTICSTQIKGLLGLSFKADGFRDVVFGTLEHYGDIRKEDAILSAICVLVLLLMQV
jgi:sodium-independent sulfate anion transporter 11